MDAFFQDCRHGLRSLLRSPGLALTAIVTIGVGAGANAAVFSFIDALLLRPAPAVSDPGSLVAIYTSDFSSGPYGSTSYPDYQSIRAEASAFRRLAAYADRGGVIVTIGANTERLGNSVVSPEFFDVLGVPAAAGRLFGPADSAPGAPPAAVIGYQAWQRLFGGEPSAVGSTIAFGGRQYTVVGVVEEGFQGLDLAGYREVWTLLDAPRADPSERGNRGLDIIGRLADGATLDQARAQLSAIAGRLAAEFPQTNRGTLEQPDRPRPMTAVWHTRIGPDSQAQVAMIGAVVMAASLLVLLTACANVGNLLLARARSREREIAIRVAVGAGRRQVFRQLTAESLLLGVAGGVVGVVIALWTADALPSFFPPEQVQLLGARVDGRVLAFCLGAATLASVVFGIAPAAHALRPAPADVLRRETIGASMGRGGSRLRRGFVVLQVAMTVVLLIGSSLLVRSLRNALEADLGFGAREAVVVSIELPPELEPARRTAYFRDAVERVRALPGIRQVALSSTTPMTRGNRRGFRIDGYQPPSGEDMELFVNTVSPGYFDTMQMPIVAGRRFDDRDSRAGAPAIIVNEMFARRYFNGAAVDRVVRDSAGTELQIVGVVRSSMQLDPQSPVTPVVYYPIPPVHPRSLRLIAGTAVPPSSVLDAVSAELRSIGSGVAVFNQRTLDRLIDEALAGDRLTASLVSVCGALALLLAMVGVYGVVAYSVTARRKEIGVRMALGASGRQVSAMVLTEGLRLTLAGAVVGALVAPAATSALGSMLYRVSPTDAVTFVSVPLLLIAIGGVAALVPMRRASRLDPVSALRQVD